MRLLPSLFALLAAARLAAAEPADVSSTASGQSATLSPTVGVTLRGRVSELGGEDPVAAAVVELDGLSRSTETDAQGRYQLEGVSAPARLRFSAPGYEPMSKAWKGAPFLNASLRPLDLTLQSVYIHARKKDPPAGLSSLPAEQIRKVPGTGGDPLRAMQALPGVVMPDDFSGRLVVRGDAPAGDLYLIDNLPWPQPYHFGGALSTVSSALLEDVDLYASNIPLRWGDATGAVLDAQTRPGRKDRFQADLDLSILSSGLVLEGPLPWRDASITLAFRRSYYDLVLPKIIDVSQFQALPYFWDGGASLDVALGPYNHIRALSLLSDDVLRTTFTAADTDNPDFLGALYQENSFLNAGFTWTNSAHTRVSSALTPYYYQAYSQNSFGRGYSANLYPQHLGVKEDLDWRAGAPLGLEQRLGLGGELEETWFRADGYDFSRNGGTPGGLGWVTAPLVLNESGDRLRGAAYAQDQLALLPGLKATLGLRYDRVQGVADDSVDPRAGLQWTPREGTTWRASWGIQSQAPGLDQLDPGFGNPHLSLARSTDTVLGVERTLRRGVSARLEAYYRDLRDLVQSEPPPLPYAYDNAGSGDAKGVELFVKADLSPGFFGWLSYAYSRSERLAGPGQPWGLFQYDSSHVATLVGTWQLTPQWSVGLKTHYQTGPLVTPLVGRTANSVDISGWYPVYGEPYSERLGDYLRVDLRTDYSWLYEGWRLNAYVEMINVAGRQNPEGIEATYGYAGTTTDYNLPRFPNLGLDVQF